MIGLVAETKWPLGKYLSAAALFIALSLAGYWAKCQLGVNIFSSISWEEHLRFLDFLQRTERVIRPEKGTVFTSTFDELLPHRSWGGVWAREAGTVTANIVNEGVNGSSALLVESTSVRDWAVASHILVEVRAGDTFEISGYARTTAGATGGMGVTLYDGSGKVTNWDSALVFPRGADWRPQHSILVVPEGVVRVRFRLSGNGVGRCYFDDIEFTKVR